MAKLKPRYVKMMSSRPTSVALVGMGPSSSQFVSYMQKHNRLDDFPDEIWGINFTANWLAIDKCFLMDGIKKGDGTSEWLMWLKYKREAKFPIIMPFPMSGFDNVVPYPIYDVVRLTGEMWYNNTLAYAMAYACALGSVKRLDLWGCDFAYTQRVADMDAAGKETIAKMEAGSKEREEEVAKVDQQIKHFVHNIETGHACGAYWAGLCRGFGVKVRVPTISSFLDYEKRDFYGYGNMQPDIKQPTETVKANP